MVKIDYDKPTQLQLLKAYFLLRYLGADVLTYKTGNGWHIYAIFPEEIPIHANLTLRRLLNDDENRIWFDELRMMNNAFGDWFDTLFLQKMVITKNGKKKSWEELANPLYEPWFLRKERSELMIQ